MNRKRNTFIWVRFLLITMMCICLSLAVTGRALAQDENPPTPIEEPTETSTEIPVPTEIIETDTEVLTEQSTTILIGDAPAESPPEGEIVLSEEPTVVIGSDPSGRGDVTGLQCDNGSPTGVWNFSFFLATADHLNGFCHINGSTVEAWWDAPIQKAIDYAEIGSIVSLDGPFTEAFHISKPLVIDGGGTTTIHSPADIPATNFYMADTSIYNPIILVSETSGVTIQGLHIAGDAKGLANYRFAGIIFGDSSGAIIDNYIEGINDGQNGDSPTGLGIFIYNTGIDPQTVTISGNTIEDFQKAGIAVEGANLTVNVTDNTITGDPVNTTGVQIGVQFTNNAAGVISTNTIRDLNCLGCVTNNPIAIAGANIAGNLTISNNTLTNNTFGIYLDHVANSDTNGNTITGGYAGFFYVNEETGRINASLTNNSITDNSYGVFSSSALLTVNNNNITGNEVGLAFMGQLGIVMDATMNYWGCDTGPNTGTCDTVHGTAMYIPFLIGPVGTPNNTLPTTYSPFSSATTFEPVIVLPEELNVIGGQEVDLSCDHANRLTLPDGTNTLFTSILCGYSVSMTPQANSLTVTINQNGVPVDVLPGNASYILSLAIPQGMQPPYSIVYWDATLNSGAGGWLFLPSIPALLHEGDTRMVLSGATQNGNFMQVQVNFTGTFVLVSQ